jgi:hypothetical protein
VRRRMRRTCFCVLIAWMAKRKEICALTQTYYPKQPQMARLYIQLYIYKNPYKPISCALAA